MAMEDKLNLVREYFGNLMGTPDQSRSRNGMCRGIFTRPDALVRELR
jgi:hypothetical protein